MIALSSGDDNVDVCIIQVVHPDVRNLAQAAYHFSMITKFSDEDRD